MKKVLLVINILIIIITIVLLTSYNNSQRYGLEALEDWGNYMFCLFALGIETLMLIILIIMLFIENKEK
jgi:hypothetical protein